jgi:hypothetical protein
VIRHTYPFRCHGQVGTIVVTRNGISSSRCGYQIVQIAEGTDFRNHKGLNSEEEADNEDDKCVYIIREKTRVVDEHHAVRNRIFPTLPLFLRQKYTGQRRPVKERWRL